jgi:hypothetical protein
MFYTTTSQVSQYFIVPVSVHNDQCTRHHFSLIDAADRTYAGIFGIWGHGSGVQDFYPETAMLFSYLFAVSYFG